jgi:RimJ/RimL family protein N-acetyltransferase
MRLRLSSRRLVLTPEQPADAGWLADLFTARGEGMVTVELAYEVLPGAQGRGYATEASRALMDVAWDTGRDRLWATIRARNVASLRVADELGFVHHHRSTDADGELPWFRCDR